MDSVLPEIIANFFKYFGFDVFLSTFCLVCKKWQQVCENTILPKQLQAVLDNENSHFACIKTIKRYRISELILLANNMSIYTFATILRSSSRLKTVVCFGNIVREADITDEPLEHTKIRGITTLAISAKKIKLLRFFPDVTRLQLHGPASAYVLVKPAYLFPNVEELAIAYNGSDGRIEEIEKVFPNLKLVHVYYYGEEIQEHNPDYVWKASLGKTFLPDRIDFIQTNYLDFYNSFGQTMLMAHFMNEEYEGSENIDTTFEYELDLLSRRPEYTYPSLASKFRIQNQQSKGITFESYYLEYVAPHETDPELWTALNHKTFVTKNIEFPFWAKVRFFAIHSEIEDLARLLATYDGVDTSLYHPQIIAYIFSFFGRKKFEEIFGAQNFKKIISLKDENNNSLVHCIRNVEFLISIEDLVEDWDPINDNNETPIGLAIDRKDLVLTEFFISKGVNLPVLLLHDVTLLNEWKNILDLAFMNNEENVKKILFDGKWIHHAEENLELMTQTYGARLPYMEDSNGITFFNFTLVVINETQLSIIPLLVHQYKIDINHVDATGCSPLITAIVLQNLTKMEMVLKLGADPNLINPITGMTPLLVILLNFPNVITFTSMLDLLIAFGADINMQHQMGDSTVIPLNFAINQLLHRNLNPNTLRQIVAIMLSRGARTDVVDEKGNTLLIWAILHDPSLVPEIIPLVYTSINAKNSSNNSALHEAIKTTADTTIIELLLRHGADVQALDEVLQPPLLLAIKCGNFNAVKVLLNDPRVNVNAYNILAPLLSNICLITATQGY